MNAEYTSFVAFLPLSKPSKEYITTDLCRSLIATIGTSSSLALNVPWEATESLTESFPLKTEVNALDGEHNGYNNSSNSLIMPCFIYLQGTFISRKNGRNSKHRPFRPVTQSNFLVYFKPWECYRSVLISEQFGGYKMATTEINLFLPMLLKGLPLISLWHFLGARSNDNCLWLCISYW